MAYNPQFYRDCFVVLQKLRPEPQPQAFASESDDDTTYTLALLGALKRQWIVPLQMAVTIHIQMQVMTTSHPGGLAEYCSPDSRDNNCPHGWRITDAGQMTLRILQAQDKP